MRWLGHESVSYLGEIRKSDAVVVRKHAMKEHNGNGGTAPFILNVGAGGGEWSVAPPPEKELSIIQRKGCWMGTRVGLGVLEEREMMIREILTKF
jgi:hypothetical protein